METDLMTARMNFTHNGMKYTLEAVPVDDGWSMRLVRPDGRIGWNKTYIEKPTAELAWKLSQICQPQEYKDWRSTDKIVQTPEEREKAEATLRVIVDGHLDSLAVLDALK